LKFWTSNLSNGHERYH